jgi:hypothetical protein
MELSTCQKDEDHSNGHSRPCKDPYEEEDQRKEKENGIGQSEKRQEFKGVGMNKRCDVGEKKSTKTNEC